MKYTLTLLNMYLSHFQLKPVKNRPKIAHKKIFTEGAESRTVAVQCFPLRVILLGFNRSLIENCAQQSLKKHILINLNIYLSQLCLKPHQNRPQLTHKQRFSSARSPIGIRVWAIHHPIRIQDWTFYETLDHSPRSRNNC